jgi:hypothetical protein
MRSRMGAVLTVCLTLGLAQGLRADAHIEQRTKFQLAGVLGKVVNFFGGKSAREGVTSTVSVKGDRKVRISNNDGQIIDLAEEKIYDLDLKKKTYTVVTFAELKRGMEEARKKAEEDAKKERAKESPAPAKSDPDKKDEQAKEFEVDFTVKNTGEKKTVNGFDTTQSIITVTVREKGKTLEQSGGMVMTSAVWLTPTLPALKEVQEFDVRYAKKLAEIYLAGASPQETASAMALYPMMKPAVEKMAAEAAKMQGTPVQTVTTLDAVKSAEQIAAEQKDGASAKGAKDKDDGAPTSLGGLLGGFGKKIAKKASSEESAAAPKDRATVLTTTSDVLKATTVATAEEMTIPSGFKLEK